MNFFKSTEHSLIKLKKLKGQHMGSKEKADKKNISRSG